MFAIEGNWKTSDKDGENRLRVKLIGKTSGIHEKDENEQTQVRHAPGRPNQMIPLPQRPPPTTSRDPSIDQPPRRPMAARLSKKGELGSAPPCPLCPCRWRWLPRFPLEKVDNFHLPRSVGHTIMQHYCHVFSIIELWDWTALPHLVVWSMDR